MSDFYSLIVGLNNDSCSVSEDYVDFPKSRFLEHTVKELRSEFDPLDKKAISKIIEFPTLFAIEQEEKKTRVGKVKDIRILQNNLRIYFEFDESYGPLPQGTLSNFKQELDINDREMRETHWAIKNIDLLPIIKQYKIEDQPDPSLQKKLLNFRDDGSISTKESKTIEFKQEYASDFKIYLKSIMAFANAEGGHIIFGVSDKPRKLVGIDEEQKQQFNSLDEATISQIIQTYCSEEISVSQELGEQQDKEYCYFEIKEAIKKPVICIRDWQSSDNNNKSRNKTTHTLYDGDIYFRSAGKSEKIKHRQLNNIIQNERDKEKRLFLELIKNIATIGAGNISLLSTTDGKFNINGKTLTLDEKIIKQLNFIKEGEFVEKDGAPAYVIKGEISNINAGTVIEKNIDPNKSHPYEGREQFLTAFKEKYQDYSEGEASFGNKIFSLKYIFSREFIKNEGIEGKSDLFWSNSRGNDKKYAEELLDIFYQYLENEKSQQEPNE